MEQRNLQARGQRAQFIGRKIPMAGLNGTQLIEHQADVIYPSKPEVSMRVRCVNAAIVRIAAAMIGLIVSQPIAVRAQSTPPARSSYTGPGSCAAASCHGSVRPVAGSRIQQTEYNTWVLQDKHARAAEVLGSALSLRIARNLGLPRADTAAKCLACHALNAPENDRAKTFANEGVSCESCHGPASAWLGPHTTRNWTHEQSIALGMYDTRDPIKRVERCGSCHIGSAEHSVDHEMIAAGHPDLVFDLEAFSNAMPKHWQDPPTADPFRGTLVWSVGQLMQLRQGLERVGRRARGDVWPEYAELDCFACHHSLTRAEDSWRQELGYHQRRAGTPVWNGSRIAVARLVARDLDAAAADRLDADFERLTQAISTLQADRTRIADLASTLQSTVDGLARRAAARTADAATTLRLMRAIVDDADRIASGGERSAEQAAMSMEALFAAYTKGARDLDERTVRSALDALFGGLENPSAYDPRKFSSLLKAAGAALRRQPTQ
jgi:hypothetical protein